MENQSYIHLFPLLIRREFYPPAMGKILKAFYSSNKKYLSLEELKSKTQLNQNEIEEVLNKLKVVGEVKHDATTMAEQDLFYLDTEGCIESLHTIIEENRILIEFLEEIIETRDSSNKALNQFIKSSIAFNSEVLDVIERTFKEYFTKKDPNS
ncbi:hypothetical protein [Aquimarina algicola]|uniref:Uncharacterized protein n=1 Tax=Aquimarina algicola TaxID=2589995 RepID=A0A504JER4_9FLAO|nr:hypothetical protein [Aquimarina algicola]TPN86935.1 hypothetical protein FHK87_04850 [Aquimarina algicola]